MTDCLIFAALFATFAVMRTSFAGGPTGKQLFDLGNVAVETALLLTSSMTYGLAMLAAYRQRSSQVLGWLAVTFLLGLGFIILEVHEFLGLVAIGAGPDRSAFLSSFFTLVATHGLHVTFGLIWMAVMMLHVVGKRHLSETDDHPAELPEPVLALPGHRLDLRLLLRLPVECRLMDHASTNPGGEATAAWPPI